MSARTLSRIRAWADAILDRYEPVPGADVVESATRECLERALCYALSGT